MESVTDLIRRWEKLRQDKSVWFSHWDDLARVMLPRRLGFTTATTEGDRRTETLFDGTPMRAARGLANAVSAMLRPEGHHWFSLRADDDEIDNSDEAKAWLADSESRLRAALETPRARFRQATGECDLDLVVFGSAVMFIGEGLRLNHLLFQSVHLKDATVFFSDEGEPEGMFRLRRFTLRQAMERFGPDSLSDTSKKMIDEKKIDEKIDVLHAVVPRKEGREGAILSRNLPVADIWIELGEKHQLQAGGFHEFPFIVPRWDTSSGEDYGRSPGMIALPDSNTLQAMGETLLVAGQRAADPPLMMPNDGMMDAPNTFPGGLGYYDVETAMALRGNPIFPLDPGSNMPLTREMQMDMREQVFAAFFRNVLNLPPAADGDKMTAAEVNARKEEFIREIGPVFGRLETDYTAPLIERAFNIMLRAGAFAPIPAALAGRTVRFEYESPVKRVRQQVEALAARLWVQEMLAIAEVKPEAADLVNVDAYGRFGAEAGGIPNGLVNGEEEVARLRQARAQVLEQAQQQAEIHSAVETADVAAGAAQKAGLVKAA